MSKLPDGQTAYNTLFDKVHTQVFLHKLASAGIPIRSAEEAASYLDLGSKLRMIDEAQAIKVAQDSESPLNYLHSLCDQALGQMGHQTKVAEAQYDRGRRDVAATLAQDPVLYNAVLGFKEAQARMIQAQQ